ncbi:MAG: sulfatase-like hydrolase/transferase, partial [bacterium]|nr:sulfatase-like hydrolase/transferase [bacterium]
SHNGASDRFEGSLNSAGPYQGFKRSMYEGGIRTPFLARWPGKIQAGSTSDLPTYFPDFMPTSAELAGADEHVPEGIDGMSIVAELLGTSKLDRERHMYWEWERFNWKTQQTVALMQAVRQGEWKILRNNSKNPWELYNLSQDIPEKNNLAGKHPDIVSRLDVWVKATRTEPRPQIEPSKPDGQRWR